MTSPNFTSIEPIQEQQDRRVLKDFGSIDSIAEMWLSPHRVRVSNSGLTTYTVAANSSGSTERKQQTEQTEQHVEQTEQQESAKRPVGRPRKKRNEVMQWTDRKLQRCAEKAMRIDLKATMRQQGWSAMGKAFVTLNSSGAFRTAEQHEQVFNVFWHNLEKLGYLHFSVIEFAQGSKCVPHIHMIVFYESGKDLSDIIPLWCKVVEAGKRKYKHSEGNYAITVETGRQDVSVIDSDASYSRALTYMLKAKSKTYMVNKRGKVVAGQANNLPDVRPPQWSSNIHNLYRNSKAIVFASAVSSYLTREQFHRLNAVIDRLKAIVRGTTILDVRFFDVRDLVMGRSAIFSKALLVPLVEAIMNDSYDVEEWNSIRLLASKALGKRLSQIPEDLMYHSYENDLYADSYQYNLVAEISDEEFAMDILKRNENPIRPLAVALYDAA